MKRGDGSRWGEQDANIECAACAEQWMVRHPLLEDSNAIWPCRLSNRCIKPVVSDDRALETAVGAAVPEISRLF